MFCPPTGRIFAIMNRYFITTAIPYVNARPHIGFALEIVQADCIARYHRLLGEDVYFLTGTDENALKNVQAAEKEGITTQELVEKNAQAFKDLTKTLNISNGDFIRTTEKRHLEGAQKLWRETKKEDIYKKKYTGLYCVGCEQFYTEDELLEGKCPEHLVKPQHVEEENYFFRLSAYQQRLEKLIESDELKVIPQIRKNEVLSFIKQGLEDFSISRSVERAKGWGVPVPDDQTQIMYVWYDAIINYITALGYGEKDNSLFQKYWVNNPNRVHTIGKGITRFHAIYWPAMLLSAGILPPTFIFAHGYITSEGQKMSKSLGNVVDPFEVVEKYGTDAVRYYLLREIPAYGDGDFSERRFKEIYNADLANGLGNLIARVAKLCEISRLEVGQNSAHRFSPALDRLTNFQFDRAIQAIWGNIEERNHEIDEYQLWEQPEKKGEILRNVVTGIRQIAFDLQPFLPATADTIVRQFAGPTVNSEVALFPRI